MSNLTIISQINEYTSIAKTFAESGLFSDCRQQAQAFVKIMAGAELGLPPFTSMNAFHIIQGKVTLAANTIAARIKASGRYDYRVVEKSARKCTIAFYQRGELIHTETWDDVRAKQAEVKNMSKFPDAMLFSRCISAGARVACPDVIGSYYTPEEMGANVNEEGEVIIGDATPAAPSPAKAIPAASDIIEQPAQPVSAADAIVSPASSGKASEADRKRLIELGKKYKALQKVETDPLVERARAALTNGSKALVDEAIAAFREIPFID